MDLFDLNQNKDNARPLADKMRANTLDEFIGQKQIVGGNSLLRRAIALDRLGSCIFWGPPGCGKTTLANIIAKTTKGNFIKMNAVSSGVADVKKAVEEATNSLKLFNKRTYLLLDECHRFNKTQLDSLLPSIENGTLIFIGSTTENPYASMTPAIVSRCRVFKFEKLFEEDIVGALKTVLTDKEKGFGYLDTSIEPEALQHIANVACGDLRTAYNALELAVLTTPPQKDGKIIITLKDAEESIQKKSLAFNEDMYFDMLSAFCKSLRGSDSNSALYWAMRLIEGGLDPMIIARRLVAHSSEDVGMADPQALQMATSAMYALEKMGAPEGLIPLCHAIIYVCEAEKSNSVIIAMYGAREDAINHKDDVVPPYLKNSVYAGTDDKKISSTYKYPHDFGGYVEQQYLPDSLKDKKYYIPKDNGFEKVVKETRQRKGVKN